MGTRDLPAGNPPRRSVRAKEIGRDRPDRAAVVFVDDRAHVLADGDDAGSEFPAYVAARGLDRPRILRLAFVSLLGTTPAPDRCRVR
ncbi:MAG: hypothetical protein ACRDTE_02940 [Pseudonocardiaceae bacterium]